MDYKPQTGDIFLCDSDRMGAKMVKFFMQAPTLWQWIWRYMLNTQETVRFYHAGMILNETQIIEQQGKVQIDDINKIFPRKIVIYRMKYLTPTSQLIIQTRAKSDIGKTYGIVLVLAKTLTWLTGLTLFVNVFGALDRQHEICINRVCKWYNHFCDFGSKKYFVDNTKTVDEYCQKHPEEWEVVYQNGV